MTTQSQFIDIKSSFESYEARRKAHQDVIAAEKVDLIAKVAAAGFTAEEAAKIEAYMNS